MRERMLVSRRILESPNQHLQPVTYKARAESPEPLTVDSDIVVILAALLCALICVVGLALVARCAWLRRSTSYLSSSPGDVPPPHPDKGVKKKVLRSLPRLSFHQGSADAKKLLDCPICLAEFVEGDEIRVLPLCGHGFHIDCIDTWLRSHCSCPSCRQILALPSSRAAALAPSVTSRCQRCGASSAAASADEESGVKAREDGDAYRFLP